ncbi:MAG: cupin domain-containing protein [Chloroflexi bacterium]|nr:cupin domain-containing protein [Chloroflexota bacterium]
MVIQPGQGESVTIGRGLGVVFKLRSRDTGGSLAIVEHPLAPGALAAPPHSHAREDEISYILEGEVGVQIGDEVVQAGEGSYIVKPRGVPHTFWNAGSRPARILEIISPAGFETYFEELAEAVSGTTEPDFVRLGEIAARYGLTMYPEHLPDLMNRYGVTLQE